MNLRTALDKLPDAEIAVAHFNALRTATATNTAGIARADTRTCACLVDPTRPGSSYYNRAFTRGAEALSAAALAELPGSVVAIETNPADLNPDASALLLGRGFTPNHQLCYLACTPVDARPVDRDVVRLHHAQVDEFLDLLQQQGVDFPPAKRQAKRQFYCTDQVQAYVARASDGTVCGWTTLFLGDGYAFFGNAYTVPAFRRSGAHSALLAARLNAAFELGIPIVYADVEHQSQSHYNCERAGFRTLTITTIWVRQA